jgi:hypothetical protein
VQAGVGDLPETARVTLGGFVLADDDRDFCAISVFHPAAGNPRFLASISDIEPLLALSKA